MDTLRINPKSRKKVARFGEWILMLLAVVWSIFPIYYIVISAFKMPRNIFAYPPKIFPSEFTTVNFLELFKNWSSFPTALVNSLIVTLAAVLLTVAVSLLAGFAYSRFSGKLVKNSAIFLLVIRMFPPIIISIPLYPVLNSMNKTVDPRAVLVLLYSAFEVAIMTWIFKTAFDRIPRELEEAALVDGCTQFQSFVRILIPLVAPTAVAVSILVGIYSWNEYTFAFLFTSSGSQTTPVLIAEMMGGLTGPSWGQVFAASVLQMIPMIFFLLIIQRFIVSGLMGGSLKG